LISFSALAEKTQITSLDTKIPIDEKRINKSLFEISNISDYEFMGAYREVVKDVYYDTPSMILNKNGYSLRNRKSLSKKSNKWFLKIKTKLKDNIIATSEIKIQDSSDTQNIVDVKGISKISTYLKDKLKVDISDFKPVYSDEIIRFKYFFKNKSRKKILLQLSFDEVTAQKNKQKITYYEFDISSEPYDDNQYVIEKLIALRKQFLKFGQDNFSSNDISKYSRGFSLY